MTHICFDNLTIIGSDNGLLLGRCQTIMWTNAGILLIGTLGSNFNEILIEIHTFSFKKMHLKRSVKWRPFCLDLNMLRQWQNVCKFADDIFRFIFLNVICILYCDSKYPRIYSQGFNFNSNNPALSPIMVWSQTGNKPLSQPMMV